MLLQVSASGKAILITGCESPLAWCLARKLDELGFTIFAGFTKRTGCADADLLKEESSGRTKILQLDVTSETQVAILECVGANQVYMKKYTLNKFRPIGF